MRPCSRATEMDIWVHQCIGDGMAQSETEGKAMKPLVRFGRKIPIPSSLQVRHELRSFIAQENVRELCAEAEGVSSSATWEEICAHRVRVAAATKETTTG